MELPDEQAHHHLPSTSLVDAAAAAAAVVNDEGDVAVGAKRSRTRARGGAAPLNKRRIGFQHKWLSKYALRVTSVDAVTSEVLVLACRLCEKFGREKLLPPTTAGDENSGSGGAPRAKRRPSTHVKHFKAPWRSDNIAHHARDQHARRFSEYELLTDKQREAYLEYTGPPHRDGIAPSSSVLVASSAAAAAAAIGAAHAVSAEADASDLFSGVGVAPVGPMAVVASNTQPRERVVSLVNAPIVDTILADLLLDLDSEYEALVHDPAQVLAIFTRHPRVGRKLENDVYLVTAPSKLEFELCLSFVATGASLRQSALLVKDAQERAPKSRIGAVSTVDTISFVRFAAAMNFQTLSSILASTWAFSLVLDGQSSHLDVRLRVNLSEHVQDFHLLALPVYDRHSPQYMYDSLARLLGVLQSDWQHKLVGVVSTGRAAPELAALLSQSTSDGCYRVRSGAQQIEAVVDALFRQLFDEAFVNGLTAMTGHLRHHEQLIAAMQGSVCPRFVNTSWHSMGRLIDWFSDKRLEVKSYFDLKKPACAPPGRWWVLMAALKRFKDIVDNTLGKIRGLTTQLGQQRELIGVMIAELLEVGYVRGPYENLFEARDFDLEDGQKFVFGRYYATQRGAEALLEDLDPFVFEQLESLKKKDGSAYLALVASVAYVFGESVNELAKITGGGAGGGDDALATKLPSVLPHELVLLSGSEMNRLLRTQQLRLCATFSKDEASAIHSEHAQLKTAYIREASFKAQVDRAASSWSFAKAWGGVGELYPRLRNFAGGLATVFPDASGAAAVCDFRVRGYERGEFRSALVDFSLEAALHARQFPKLQELAATLGL